MKKLLIAGGTGFVGSVFVDMFSDQYGITILTRDTSRFSKANVKTLAWSALSKDKLAEFDAVINLSGENIASQRWSQKRKQAILNSRLETTKTLVEKITSLEKPPFYINASAVGIYPAYYNQTSEMVFSESHAVSEPKNFLNKVALKWEKALTPLQEKNIPYAVTRFGVVIGKQGGMLKQLLPSFAFGMGAVIGSGAQGLPWVSVKDVVAALRFLVDQQQTGTFNVVAMEHVSQKTFAKTLAKVLHRPCFMKLPASVIKVLFGQMGEELLLSGQQVANDKIIEAGFQFQFPQLEAALKDALNRN